MYETVTIREYTVNHMEIRKLDQEAEWQRIWVREGLLTRMVNAGRHVYNYFFLRMFRRYLTKESRFLELGSGTSSLLIQIAPKVKEAVGLDITEASIKLSEDVARKAGTTNTHFILGDCLTYPFKEEYDVVWSQGLMEHFQDPVSIARSHYRALKPGGVALISVPYRYSYHHVWYILTRPKFLRFLWPWTDQVFYNKKHLRKIGREVTPNCRAFLIQPFPLGLAILELRK